MNSDKFSCDGIYASLILPCSLITWSFIDIDECSAGTDMCASNATCTNTEGGYNCSCDTGYHGDGFTCNSVSSKLYQLSLAA